MSTGGKVGLAFGLILLFLLLIAGAIALYRKRRSDKEHEHHRLDDEKNFLAGARKTDSMPQNLSRTATEPPMMMARPTSFEARAPETLSIRQSTDSAPQLSVRAVSSFNPGLPMGNQANNQPALPQSNLSNKAALGAAGLAGAVVGTAAAPDVSPPSSSGANDPANPFGNHAEKLGNSPAKEVPVPVSPIGSDAGPSTPKIEAADFPLPESTPETPSVATFPKPEVKPAVVATGAAAGAGAAAIMAATAAAASNKPQGGPPAPSTGVDNVHRVQLDFKPSMDDELEIHAGQLVRLLHEYDDGWVSVYLFSFKTYKLI
jgi:hypothetical protein